MKGLILSLKKSRKSILRSDNSSEVETFSVFGYYSFLSYKETTSIKSFAPDVVNENDSEKKHRKRNEYDNEFHIRLIDNSKDYGNTDIFQRPFTQKVTIDFQDKPLLSLILLHFTKEKIAKNRFDDIQKEIAVIIQNVMIKIEQEKTEELGKPFKVNAIFSQYSCLGSIDIVVVCRSDNFYIAGEILSALREQEKFLSTSYLIPSMVEHPSKKQLSAWRQSVLDHSTQLSIRVMLQPGISEKSFINKFEADLNDKHIILDKDNIYNKMSGSSDVLVLTMKPASDFATMYAEKSVLLELEDNPYVSSLRTSVRLIQEKSGAIATPWQRAAIPQQQDINVNNIIEKADEYLRWHIDKLPRTSWRIRRAVFSMLSHYFSVMELSHNFDIRHMLDPFVINMVEALTYAKKQYEEYNRGNNKESQEKAIKFIEKIDEAINEFRRSFENMISDVTRGNRKWSEGQILTHQAIGNAEKLVIMYYILILKAVKLFAIRKSSYYAFVVSSGGTDNVEAKEFFANLDKKREHPILVEFSLPEKSLYNVSETLFAVYHEAFHFIGDRKRDERRIYLIQSISGNIAYMATLFIITSLENDIEKSKDLKDEFKKRIKSKKNLIILNKYVSELLTNELNSKTSDCESGYLIDLESAITEALQEILAPIDFEKMREKVKNDSGCISERHNTNEFVTKLDVAIYNYLAIIHDYVNQRFNRKDSIDIQFKTRYDKRKEYINKITNHTFFYLISLVENLEHDDIWKNELDIKPIESVVNDIVSAYREGYSDICSATLLNYDVEKYLCYFMSDESKFDDIFPFNFSSFYRFCSVTCVLYGRENVDITIDYLKTNSKINPNIVEKVHNMFKVYDSMEVAMNPLEKYLKLCKDDIEAKKKNNYDTYQELEVIYKNRDDDVWVKYIFDKLKGLANE